jgi:hypothetical protein
MPATEVLQRLVDLVRCTPWAPALLGRRQENFVEGVCAGISREHTRPGGTGLNLPAASM